MRLLALALLSVPVLSFSGCKPLDPNSKWNVNRGEYHDEYDIASKEGRNGEEIEKEPDGLGKWLYSPKARAIDRHLGVEY
jgi:hypothetical protein